MPDCKPSTTENEAFAASTGAPSLDGERTEQDHRHPCHPGGLRQRGPKAVDELIAEDFTPHDWGQAAKGREAMLGAIRRSSKGLSDVEMRIEDIIGEGDLVAVRLTSSATQTGEFMGRPPSGNRYTIPEIHIFRIRDGQVTEHWHQLDMLGMQRQLKATPATQPAAAGQR